MKLHQSYLGKWLVLGRVQSVPVTIFALLVAVGTVWETILTPEILPIVALGVVAHLSVYAHNDYSDYRYDLKAGKDEKPLVSGDIQPNTAATVITAGIVAVIALSLAVYGLGAAVAMSISVALGLYYNRTSKESAFAAVILGGWGFSIIMTGGAYAGDINDTTLIVGLLMSIHMFWMTIEGDIKDLGEKEDSIPDLLESKVTKTYSERTVDHKRIWHNGPLRQFGTIVLFVEISVAVVLSGNQSAIGWILLWLLSATVLVSGISILSERPYKPDKIKKIIAVHTVATALLFLYASLYFMTPVEILAMAGGGITWGLGWQYILYGDPLYFP